MMFSIEKKSPDIIRKIDLMHRLFGKCEGQICGDCSHFYQHNYGNVYFKCEIYGNSHAMSTDWRKKYPACSLFNKEYRGGDIVKLVGRTSYRIIDDEPLEGQITFEDGDDYGIL